MRASLSNSGYPIKAQVSLTLSSITNNNLNQIQHACLHARFQLEATDSSFLWTVAKSKNKLTGNYNYYAVTNTLPCNCHKRDQTFQQSGPCTEEKQNG